MIGGVLAKVLVVAIAVFSKEIESNRGAEAILIVFALGGAAAWLMRQAKN